MNENKKQKDILKIKGKAITEFKGLNFTEKVKECEVKYKYYKYNEGDSLCTINGL